MAAVTAALVPILILAHEMGHLVVGLAVDVPNPRIGFAGFRHDPAPWLASWQIAVIAIAGPVVSLAAALIAPLSGRYGRAGLASSVSVAACMRLAELLPYGLAASLRRLSGRSPRMTMLDEERAFGIVGFYGDLALIVATIVFAMVLWANLRRQSCPTALALVLGGVAGWAIWSWLVRLNIIQ